MPYKMKDPYRHKFPPMKFKVTNWKAYNQALKKRGDITIWFDPKETRSWYAKRNGKPGAQRLYSNMAIETAEIIRMVFRLPYRQTEGFMNSMTKLMNLDLRIPDYSTLSRRLSTLSVRLRPKGLDKRGTHIIIDASGLSVYGADEFHTLKKAIIRVRGYRRINIAINEYQEIVACELTTIHGNEKKQVAKLLRNIHGHCELVIADGNYDDRRVYTAIKKYRPSRYIRLVKRDKYRVIIPPRSDARIRKTRGIYPLERSEHIKMIQKHGRMRWQEETGYGKRSLVEVAFYRYKRILGKLMHSIRLDNQKVEAKLACKALNIMTSLGMPETVRIA